MHSHGLGGYKSVPLVKNILLLDSEGKRVAVKHYDEESQNLGTQLAFEKSLFNKTSRTNARGEAEIIMFDNVVVVYKFVADLMFYVSGDQNENEIILNQVLNAYIDAVSLLLRNNVEKRMVLENLDLIFLAIDEITDNGILLETDANVIASRVAMRGADTEAPMGEQSFSQALGSAREQLARALLK